MSLSDTQLLVGLAVLVALAPVMGLWVVRKAQREQLGNSDELARLQAATTTGTVPKDVDRDRWAALLRRKSRSRIDWYYAAALPILVVVSSFAEAREPGSFGAAEFGAHFVYLLPALLIFGAIWFLRRRSVPRRSEDEARLLRTLESRGD